MSTYAQWIYVAVFLWCCICLLVGHRAGKINLWDCITTTKDSRTFTDAKKLAYIGAFVVMSVTFAYWGMVDRLTEWYALLYVGAWVTGKFLGDREQRLQQEIKAKAP
jgi:hypothetical protein